MTVNALTALRTDICRMLRVSYDLAALLSTTVNYLKYPGDLFSYNWAYLNLETIEHNIANINGEMLGIYLNDRSATEVGYIYQTVSQILTAGPVTFSVDLKLGTAAYSGVTLVRGDLTTWAVNTDLAGARVNNRASAPPVASGITDLGAGWYRVWVQGVSDGINTLECRVEASNGASGVGDPDVTATGTLYASRACLVSGAAASTFVNSYWSYPERVFEGQAGMMGARNRGRLPFVEVSTQGGTFHQDTRDGGTLTCRVRLRFHETGRDQATALALLQNYATAGAKCIKAGNSIDNPEMPNKYYDGDVEILDAVAGPMGWMQDVEMPIGFTYDGTTYELGSEN